MTGATTPKVLDIIRTAAADCTDSMARNELLDAAGMTRGLLDALKLAEQYAERVAATAPTEHARMTRQRQAVKDLAVIRAAIAKATGTTTECGQPTAALAAPALLNDPAMLAMAADIGAGFDADSLEQVSV